MKHASDKARDLVLRVLRVDGVQHRRRLRALRIADELDAVLDDAAIALLDAWRDHVAFGKLPACGELRDALVALVAALPSPKAKGRTA